MTPGLVIAMEAFADGLAEVLAALPVKQDYIPLEPRPRRRQRSGILERSLRALAAMLGFRSDPSDTNTSRDSLRDDDPDAQNDDGDEDEEG